MTKKINAIVTKMRPVLDALSRKPMDLAVGDFSPGVVNWDQIVNAVHFNRTDWFLASDVRLMLNDHYDMPSLLCIAGAEGWMLLDAEATGEQRYYISRSAFAELLFMRMYAHVA